MRVFMYGSRVIAGSHSLWIQPNGYPRRFYIRQLLPGDDRLAVLNDVREVSKGPSKNAALEREVRG
jgi:hypothetical protein